MDLNTQKAKNDILNTETIFISTYTFLNIYTHKLYNTAYVKQILWNIFLSDP